VDSEVYQVKSPMLGTVYTSPAPGEKPFVAMGQQVRSSDVVCIIESMKLFTEIRTARGGVVRRILFEDEAPVMKNQVLIEIEADRT
jgi:acetyl-CoA carboxylase biotin carboxyl carrier protein